jgi:hypothetical protein
VNGFSGPGSVTFGVELPPEVCPTNAGTAIKIVAKQGKTLCKKFNETRIIERKNRPIQTGENGDAFHP